MYNLVKFFGLVIRQFCLPNPFEAMWPEKAVVLNLLCGIALLPVAYFVTGFWYKEGDGAAIGSFIFNAVYIILSLALWGGIMLLKIVTDNVIVSAITVMLVLIVAMVVMLLAQHGKKQKQKKE